MSFTIADIKNRVAGKLHGSTVNKIPGSFLDLMYEAAGNLLLRIDPMETKRVATITNALFDNVNSYVVPTDLKRDKILDIRPQAGRTLNDKFQHQYQGEFDQYKSNNTFAIESRDNVRYLRAQKSVGQSATIDTGASLTANGTWAASGDASNLTVDGLNYLTGSASLNFDVAASGSLAVLTRTNTTAEDLSEWEDISSFFIWAYLPDASDVTNLILRWGNDASNYWSVTVTAQHDATSFRDGWNLLRFDWNGATETGTPASASVDYWYVGVTYDGTVETDYRIDSIVLRRGELYEMVYYSNYLFQNSSGVWLEKPTASDDTDIINLSTDTYNLFFYEVMELIAQMVQGEDSGFDLQYWSSRKNEVWNSYKAQHKSEKIKKQSNYYRM